MKLKSSFSVFIVTIILLLLGINPSSHGQQTVTPEQDKIKKDSSLSDGWENKRITIHTYEEDIQTTLRALARHAGFSITFGEGITDTVSLDLENYPAKKV